MYNHASSSSSPSASTKLDDFKPNKASPLTVDAGQSKFSLATLPAKVARNLGILPSKSSSPDHLSIPEDEKDLMITGSQLAALSTGQAAKFDVALEWCIIFAKVLIRNFKSWKANGVNDALAIRVADVGISVDSGTEIAKEATDVILLEKSLDAIAHRVLFINTIKYIKMATSSNFNNVFSVLVALAWLPYQPIQPLQLLFQNLLDNVDPEYLTAPTTWNARSIACFMIFLGPTYSIFDICTFLINWYPFGIQDQHSPLVPLAQTNWFLEVFAIPYIPKLSAVLGMSRPKPEFYGFLAAMVMGYVILVHIVKVIYQHMFKEWL
ncbi:Mg transporting ATPase [Laccaria bicolor S238N-H82]|uniref:Mg transporting ATPase n=1 Tax=Laccaria bicolor (strain S238N-H82 / ATCC MYA-4686) TaxID=486041 RepID=B0D9J5_LACBS|nr:Mg transporting ATPase [Laccaria bicolor S238N-H82]EDR08363.1 Mg transporting ATPase [Laccaria bicolor S238N-H82]|eukprot:XP_001880588.1 Mg transporting ATPase [Laccaria bicolor S238N-H82]